MRIFLLLSVFIIVPFLSQAQAGEPYTCGVPIITGEDIDARMPTETGGRCDFHVRRFAYREEALKLQELIKQRQHNYAAPRSKIEAQYREQLKALNAQRGDESSSDSYMTAEEDMDEAFDDLDEMSESE